jgi:hypothetical protein
LEARTWKGHVVDTVKRPGERPKYYFSFAAVPTFPHGKLPPTPHRTPPFGGAPRCFGEGPGAPDVRPSVTYVGPPFLAAAHRSARPKGLELNRRMVARRSDSAKVLDSNVEKHPAITPLSRPGDAGRAAHQNPENPLGE